MVKQKYLMNTTEHQKPFYKNFYFYLKATASVITVAVLLMILSVVSLRWINPPVTSFVLQEDWEQFQNDRYSLTDWWVSSDEIPNHLALAVIASEDQKFNDHRGFDIESIKEARSDIREGNRVRGASTITQQVAKNIYLTPSQSYLRKGIEAFITVLIEIFWPKERILEVYLNIAEFGPGIYGVGKASDHFFRINVPDLEPEMSARLATVLPNPKRMRVEPASPFVEERSQWILGQMSRMSGITYLPEAEEVPVELTDDPLILDAVLKLNEILLEPDSTTIDTTLSNIGLIQMIKTDNIPNK